MSVDKFESTSPELEKEFRVVRLTYSLGHLIQLAKSFKENDFRIAATYVVAVSFIWPDGDTEFIIEFIEDIDHIRRGEKLTRLGHIPEYWLEELRKVLCPTPL